MTDTPEHRAFCYDQARRLEVFGHLGEYGFSEYADAIRFAFNDTDSARRAMDEFLTGDRRPLLGEIWHYSKQQRGETPIKYCSICDGTGFRPAPFKRRDPCGTAVVDYSAVVKCECRC